MATDKEIRQFVKANMPKVKDSDRFMAELVSQIDLLPEPAALRKRSEGEIQAAASRLSVLAGRMKKHNRLTAVLVAAISVAALSGIMAVYTAVPAIHEHIMQYLPYIMGVFTVAVLASAMFALRRGRI